VQSFPTRSLLRQRSPNRSADERERGQGEGGCPRLKSLSNAPPLTRRRDRSLRAALAAALTAADPEDDEADDREQDEDGDDAEDDDDETPEFDPPVCRRSRHQGSTLATRTMRARSTQSLVVDTAIASARPAAASSKSCVLRLIYDARVYDATPMSTMSKRNPTTSQTISQNRRFCQITSSLVVDTAGPRDRAVLAAVRERERHPGVLHRAAADPDADMHATPVVNHHPMPTTQTNMRLGDADRARLDRLADERGVSRSEVVRHLLAEADNMPRPGPPSHDELLRLLGERAREGSVRAIELLLMRNWERRTSEPQPPVQAAPDDPFAEVDRMREKNVTRLGGRR
jgi:Ribbon-helix-helix protein, copG family